MNEIVTTEENIKNKIFTIRGLQVMLDRDLAELYEVETKVFNQAVKRNENRFPDDFRFQLTEAEYQNLRSQIVTSSEQDSLRSQSVTIESKRGKHTKYLPYAFTEQGVSMLSAVLKSDIAVDISVKIIRSFAAIGASLKDLGKKWFAFSRFERESFDILSRLER
ncbi:MAG: ORF6N domain-containing protein [Campylobacterales bacterium]|nr:ORF6N domain-containing protein [Campylobacterales bacterium]